MKRFIKKIMYGLLEFPMIPYSAFISISLWRNLCIYKHKLAKELGIYDIDNCDGDDEDNEE